MLKHSSAELSASPEAPSLENPAAHPNATDGREPPRHRKSRGAGAERAGPGAGTLGQEVAGAPLAQEAVPPREEGGGRRRSAAAGPRYGAASRGGRETAAAGLRGLRPPPLPRRGGAAIGPRAGRARAGGARGRPADRRGPALPLAGGKRAASPLAGARCQSRRPRPRLGLRGWGGRGSGLPPCWAWAGKGAVLSWPGLGVGAAFHLLRLLHCFSVLGEVRPSPGSHTGG